jgi:hypothetical protein
VVPGAGGRGIPPYAIRAITPGLDGGGSPRATASPNLRLQGIAAIPHCNHARRITRGTLCGRSVCLDSRGLPEAVHSLTEALAASGQDMCGPLVAGPLATNGSAFKKRQAELGCRALQSWLLSTSRQLARTCAGVPVPVSHARPSILFEAGDPAGSSLSLCSLLPSRCLPACLPACLLHVPSSAGDSLPGGSGLRANSGVTRLSVIRHGGSRPERAAWWLALPVWAVARCSHGTQGSANPLLPS